MHGSDPSPASIPVRLVVRWCTVAVLSAVLLAAAIVQREARAEAGEPADPHAARYDFDIPALPLYEALQRFSQLTGHSVLVESSLLEGKLGAPLQGRYAVRDGLTALLAGSGLSARIVRRSFVLSAAAEPPASPPPVDPDAIRRYETQLRQKLAQALCAAPAIEMGRHRMALQLWVGQDARIGPIRVVVDGRPELENLVGASLAGLLVGVPPAGLEQPAIMVLRPEAARRAGGCGS